MRRQSTRQAVIHILGPLNSHSGRQRATIEISGTAMLVRFDDSLTSNAGGRACRPRQYGKFIVRRYAKSTYLAPFVNYPTIQADEKIGLGLSIF